MAWGNLTIGKKIASGFGIVVVMLIFLGSLSFLGVGHIVENAGEVIDGNKLDGNLAQKEVDHLNWVNHVNALLTDEGVSKLKVETDYRKCGFGKWLYGEDRRQAERLVPGLSSFLKDIEAPHQRLHESAVEIGRVFRQPHTDLSLLLSNRLTDHYNWVGQLGRELASEAGGLYSYQAQLKNAVYLAMSVFEDINKNELRGENFQKDEVYKAIRGLRYGPEMKDYFFVINLDAKMVMHPYSPKLEGRDLSELKDKSGKRFFAEMVRVCKEKGEGFVTYQWPLPGSDKLAPKITYIKVYEPWGWAVGTGVYLDHTNQVLLKRADNFAAKKPFSTGLQLDPEKCAFGRFLNAEKARMLASEFTAMRIFIKDVREPHARLHQSAVQIEERVNDLDMQKAIQIFNEETQEALSGVKADFEKVISAEKSLQRGLDDANRIYAEQTIPNLTKVQDLLKKIRGVVRDNIMTDQVMLKSATGTKRNVAVVSIIAVAAGIFLAFFIARGIITGLNRITGGLGEGANQVAAAAAEVSLSSQSMAEGASQQAASIEETSSSMEEMSSMTKNNAQNASHADSLMKEANQIVTAANTSMDELIRSMEEISNASEETSKIIKTIDEIAFQTNLLALNAAVEAARAGEAGAGFAVVADEVRNLAMRAADAARNTARLIKETLGKVENGTSLVAETNEAFARVSESASKVGGLVAEISQASNEQSEGIEQVNNAITEMDKVVQQNAANAEESASASEELNAQAEQLKSYVGDLISMVSGEKEGSSRSAISHLEKAHAKQFPKTAASKKKIPADQKEIKPDQVIPFDDEDFEDF